MIEFDDFLKVDIRVGCILDVQPFPEARKPAWKLIIDFGGDIGMKNLLPKLPIYMMRIA